MPDGSCFPRLGLWYRTMSMGVGSCALYLHGFPEPYGIYHKVYVRFLISGGSHNLKLKKLCYICIGNNLIKVKTNLFIPTINSRLLQRCNRFFKWCKICLKPVFCPCISVQVACTGVRAVYHSKAREAGRWGCTCVPCFFCARTERRTGHRANWVREFEFFMFAG